MIEVACMRLKDKVAIVTGASRGIGRGIAKMFAEEGAKVVVNYNTSKNEASSLAEEIKKIGRDVLLVQADVSKADQVKNMVRNTLERFGRVDVLVNNAGTLVPAKSFLESTEEGWDRTLDVNLKGAYLCCKEVAPIMLKQKKGKIINISSISGLYEKLGMGYVDYVSSKAGMIGLTRALAVHLGPAINVNAIAPGTVETEIVAALPADVKQQMKDEALVKRLGTPQDMAYAAVYLASDESDFVTGEVLTVSGGRAIR
jgi:3-oxoacyl-[acyl-carrier protein] reductase